VSEVLAVPGVELVGPLPLEIQKVTVFTAGICSSLGCDESQGVAACRARRSDRLLGARRPARLNKNRDET